MRLLVLVLMLSVSGCGLSYEISWPIELTVPTYVVRGEPIPRTLFAGDCEYYFGQRLTDTAQTCVADLSQEEARVWSLSEIEFFGYAQAWLYGNSADELSTITVALDTPDQFEGIVDYYADLFELDPLLDSEPIAECVTETLDGEQPALRIADWKDTVTQLLVTEDGCTGLVTLQFIDIYARP